MATKVRLKNSQVDHLIKVKLRWPQSARGCHRSFQRDLGKTNQLNDYNMNLMDKKFDVLMWKQLE